MIGHMRGNVHQVADTTIALQQEQARHERFWLENSKYKTIKQVRKHLLGRSDHWATPDEAIDHGFADAIAGTLVLQEDIKKEPKKKARKVRRK